MKKIIPYYILSYYILCIFTQFSISQNTVKLQGTVTFKQNAVQDVEVINWNKETITKTDSNGIFTVLVSETDSLYFLSKNHLTKKIGIKKSEFESEKMTVELTEKTINLEEIKIIQNQSTGIKVKQGDIDSAVLQKNASRPQNKSVYMGTIENGMDFVAIFKGIVSVFKKKKEEVTETKPTISFKKFITSKFDTEYFVKTLKIKPDEISKFIAFCNEDEGSARAVEHSNILTVMDFLSKKSEAFKKL